MIAPSPNRLSVLLTGDQVSYNVFVRITGAPATGSRGFSVIKTGQGFNVTVFPGAQIWNNVPNIDPSTNLTIVVSKDGSPNTPFGTFDISITSSWGDIAHVLGTVAGSTISYEPIPPFIVIPTFVRTFNIGSPDSGVLGLHTVEATPPVVQRDANPQSLVAGDIRQVNLTQFSSVIRLDASPVIHKSYVNIWRSGLRGRDMLFLVRGPNAYAEPDFVAKYHAMFGIADAGDKVYLQCAAFNTGAFLPATVELLINNYGRAALRNAGNIEIVTPGVDKAVLVDFQLNRRQLNGLWGQYMLYRLVSLEEFTLCHMTIAQNTDAPWSPMIRHNVFAGLNTPPIDRSLIRNLVYTINTEIFDYSFSGDPLFNFNIDVVGESEIQQPQFEASVFNIQFGLHQVNSRYKSLAGLFREGSFRYNVTGATYDARILGLEQDIFVNLSDGVLGLVIEGATVIVDNNYTLQYSYDNITWHTDKIVNDINQTFVIRTLRLAPYYRIVNNSVNSAAFAPDRTTLTLPFLGPWTPDETKLQLIFPAGISGWAPGTTPAQLRVIPGGSADALALGDFWMGQDILVPNVDLIKQPILHQFPNPSFTEVFAIIKYQQAGRQTIVGADLLNGPPDLGAWEVPNVVYPVNVVSISGPTSAETGKSVTLTGSVVLAPGRSITQVYWSQVTGPLITVANQDIITILSGTMVITMELPIVTAQDQVIMQFNVVDDLGILAFAQHAINVCQPFYSEEVCVTPNYQDETLTPIVCP